MNKVVLIGRLTKDPELKYTPGAGTAVTTITLAVEKRFSKKQDKDADFIPVVIWGKSAEATAQYMAKGRLLAIAGRIQTRTYEAKDGTRRYVTEVVAEEVKFIEWGNSSDNRESNSNSNSENSSYESSFDDMEPVDDGDIPF